MFQNFVRKMIELGRFQDLLDILREDSLYTTNSCSNVPESKEEIELYVFSIKHIEFLFNKRKFSDEFKIENENEVNSLFLNHFEQWMESGSKGLEEEEVNAYLTENPF